MKLPKHMTVPDLSKKNKSSGSMSCHFRVVYQATTFQSLYNEYNRSYEGYYQVCRVNDLFIGEKPDEFLQ